MRKAILALLVISTLAIVTNADKPTKSSESKIKPLTKGSPVLSKSVGPVLKRPLKPRQFHSSTVSRLHRLAQKFPLSNSARKSRKFNVGQPKKVKSLKRDFKKLPVLSKSSRKRIQKPSPKHHRGRPLVKKVTNFARFLRAFGKQLNRPVQYPRFGAPNQKIANNRRKFKIPHGKNHPIVFKKAEDIAGYEKFTLDEVVFPEAKLEDKVKEASDRVDDIEPIFVDEIKEEAEEDNKIVDLKKEDTKTVQKLDIDPRTKKVDVR